MKHNYFNSISLLKTSLLVILGGVFTNQIQAQADYSVVSIPFQTYSATAAVQGTNDDSFSAPIPLTFDFDFYGNTYNQVNVSTNGYISFMPFAQGAFSPWQISLQIPDVNFQVYNAFLGCFEDLNNSNAQGTISYSIVGSAPYRKFVVLFDNNSHFQCQDVKSSFQMILYETLNIMDVQIIDKQFCVEWNSGNAVTGIINNDGLMAVTPPNRNTGAWSAFHEGWRFQRPFATNRYQFAKCDDDSDGFVSFNLQVAQHDLNSIDPALVSFYLSESDAISQTNALTDLNFTNTTAHSQTIYANVNGEVKAVKLEVVNCANDYDMDSVATADEDVNSDTNLANDDTDGDGIANFIDNDDDGDMILTSVEYVFPRSANNALAYLDTDNDGILNYLDNDDDGDGVLTINEDYNHNNNPADDDTNANSIPDYLEQAVALGLNHFQNQNEIALYPNPATTVLNVENKSNATISNIGIYTINGQKVKEVHATSALQSIPVADLESGVYFVKVEMNQQVFNYKFIKK